MDTLQTPQNPLIDQHPVDTLSRVQALLSFLQEYYSESNSDSSFTHHESRVYMGQYALLKVVNDALGYEIERLEAWTKNKAP